MSSIMWFFLLMMNYLCLFSLKSLMLGLFMLGCSFVVSFLMSMYSLSWYSLMFFLVYMGGLLVLFLYMSSLKFNPVFYMSKLNSFNKILLKLKVLFIFIFSMTQITWKFKSLKWSGLELSKFSFKLFNEVEILFLISIGFLLLLVLWVITKLSFRKRSALRPFFK